MEKILISIDGNIGSGKSYLLNKLRSNPDYVFIDEPLSFWQSLIENGKSILELFYEDKMRWSYTFQNCALISRFNAIENAIKKNPDKKIFICERCLETDKNIFAKMLYDDKYLTEIEYKLYNTWLALVNKNTIKLGGIIYVNTDPELSLERIKQRMRSGENKIDINYLEKLDKYHKEWIKSIEKDKIPVLSISSDEIDKTVNFIKSI